MMNPFEERIKRLIRYLSRKKAAYIVFSPENRRYLSNFIPEDISWGERTGILLITSKEAFLFTDPRYKEEAQEIYSFFQPIICKKGLWREIAKFISRLHISRLFFEENYISYTDYRILNKIASNIRLYPVRGLIERWRAQKDDIEIALIQKSLQIAEKILIKVIQDLRAGKKEKEISSQIIELSYRWADGPSFPPIVASGIFSARPHAIPSEKKVQKGEVLLIDMGVKYKGYCSDITRTFFLGPPSERFQQISALVLEAKKAAEDKIKAGVKAKIPDLAAREIFKKRKLERHFIHSLGHGVGLAIHESPSLSFKSRKKLFVNHVITVEPGLYFPEWGGVRIEDMVVVKEEGFVRLNELPPVFSAPHFNYF